MPYTLIVLLVSAIFILALWIGHIDKKHREEMKEMKRMIYNLNNKVSKLEDD
ncbi:hypothetical protein JCM16358_02390 [Halanaerocella petrolearia]